MLLDIMKRSTIQVSEELRNALKDLGKKGESYEDILWRLIKENKPKK
jgi:predicted CopG family antitoxin